MSVQVLLHVADPRVTTGTSTRVYDDAQSISDASVQTHSAASVWQVVGLACVASSYWGNSLKELAGKKDALKEIAPKIQAFLVEIGGIGCATVANAKRLKRLAGLLSIVDKPWGVFCDWNATPQQLAEQGWLKALKGCPHHP